MKKVLTPQEWVAQNVEFETLQRDVVNALRESIHQENVDEGTYTALVYDIVSGGHGIYIPQFALQFFGYQDVEDNEEGIHDEVEYFGDEVAHILNNKLPNEVRVCFGYWETDGTYCLMAYMDEDELNNHLEESHNFISEAFGDIFE